MRLTMTRHRQVFDRAGQVVCESESEAERRLEFATGQRTMGATHLAERSGWLGNQDSNPDKQIGVFQTSPNISRY
jgi:hypothetical protein